MTANADETTSRAHRSDDHPVRAKRRVRLRRPTAPRSELTAAGRGTPLASCRGPLDRIDAACCSVTETGRNEEYPYEVTVESFVSEEYPDELRERLVQLCDEETGTVDEACRLNVGLGTLLADVATRAMDEAESTRRRRGHRQSRPDDLAHRNPESLPGVATPRRSTLQIADGSVIARETGVKTVSDFRTADVAAGSRCPAGTVSGRDGVQ